MCLLSVEFQQSNNTKVELHIDCMLIVCKILMPQWIVRDKEFGGRVQKSYIHNIFHTLINDTDSLWIASLVALLPCSFNGVTHVAQQTPSQQLKTFINLATWD